MSDALRGTSLALLVDVLGQNENKVGIRLAKVMEEMSCENNKAVWQVYVTRHGGPELSVALLTRTFRSTVSGQKPENEPQEVA